MRWALLQRRLQQLRTTRAVDLIRSIGIEPIVIKGAAASRYYPEGVDRPSVDVDLAVPPDAFERAFRLVTGPNADGMAIDLHKGLRHLDTVPWDDLFDNSLEIEFPEGKIRVLRPEDDLRVLSVHWLTDGGSHKERLWDIRYLVDSARSQIDWERVLGPVSSNRQRWIECTLGLTAKYLDLDLTGTPFAGADARLPRWLVKTVEAEWSAEVKHWPLESSLQDRKMLVAQIKRRMRPNPIYATVDCEGSFDAHTRFFYRVWNGLRRVGPSYKRVTRVLRNRQGT